MLTTIPDSHIDLLESKALAYVAYQLPSGLISNNVVSFLWDEGKAGFSTLKRYHKYQCLQLNPTLTMLITDLRDPRRYIELRGHAQLSDDTEKRYINKIAKKYMDLDEYPFDQAGDERVSVLMNIQQVRVPVVEH